HRDIKPANILVADNGSVKVLDFGLVRVTNSDVAEDPNLTQAGILGTPHYMPPEQARGRTPTAAADVYSLGITLFEFLSGELPFVGEDIYSIVSGHMRKPIPVHTPSFANIPPFFAALLEGMCAKEAEDRVSIEEVIQLLQGYLGAPTTTPTRLDTSRIRSATPTNLNPRETSFVGRYNDKDDIVALLEKSRLVSLVGPGGVGKTRISQEIGMLPSVLERYPQGVYFADLTECRDIANITNVVAASIGVMLTQKDAEAQLAEALAQREHFLLILDNFEQVIDWSAESVGRWLQSTSGVRFLVTSREALHLEGESVYPLRPLKESGVKLFIDRAQLAKRDFTVDDESKEVIRNIVDELDGLPLAIELAASRIGALSPQKIFDRLPRRLELLRSRRRDASQKQLTLRGAIDWSWELLCDFEQSALAQCSVFQNGFFLEAAEAVIDLSSFPEAPFEIDVVESLVEKSLLQATPTENVAGETRYKMLESVRQYAEEKLAGIGCDTDALFERHAHHYLDYCQSYAELLHTGLAMDAVNRLTLERDNMFAIQDGVGSKQPEIGATAVLILKEALHLRTAVGQLLERLHRANQDIDKLSEVTAIRLLSELASMTLDYVSSDEGVMLAELAVERARSAPDSPEMRLAHLRALIAALICRTKRRDADEALALVKQAEELADRIGIPRYQARVKSERSFIYNFLGDYQQAERDWREALSTYRALGDDLSSAKVLSGLGMLYRFQKRYDEALEALYASNEIDLRFGRSHGVGYNLVNCGLVYQERFQFDKALECARQAEVHYRHVGYLAGVANCQTTVGIINARKGELDAALEGFNAALKTQTHLGNTDGVVVNQGNRGIIYSELGRYEEAWQDLSAAEEMCRESGDRRLLRVWIAQKAFALARQSKDQEKALELISEFESIGQALATPPGEVDFDMAAARAKALYELALASGAQEGLAEAKAAAADAKAVGEAVGSSRTYAEGVNKGKPSYQWGWIEEILAHA
ncbi:MAG: tetratricopeptide repeat protein, partial [Planctomycetes bacterium]|nr:tetratricopeptide repeat protein [Planctomycetota bacterium]